MQKLLPMLSLIVCLAAFENAFGQPRPFDSTPSDFVPPVVEEMPSPELLPSAPPAAAHPITVYSPPLPSIGPIQPEPEVSPNVDPRRYIWYGGRWWYRQPTNRWSYLSEGRWVDYVSPARRNTPPFVQPPPVRRRWQVGAGAPYYRYPY